MIDRPQVLRTVLAAALAASGAMVQAADKFPSKPIQMYVSFGPGGVGDISARILAKQFTTDMGQALIIENRPIPVVGPSLVKNSKPDGYTWAWVGNGTSLTNSLFKEVPYDLMKDFQYVSTVAFFDLAMLTGANSKFHSVADVIAYAKANPGKLNVGTSRIGSTQNLSGELFRSMSGTQVQIIPYKTTADELTALRSGDVDVVFEIVPAMLAQINSKNVKALAVTSASRFKGLPDVPTMAEAGLPGFEATSWGGVCVPAKTPPEVVAAINTEIRKAVMSPDVQKAMLSVGVTPRASSPDEMRQRMETDMKKWGEVIEKAGIPKQ